MSWWSPTFAQGINKLDQFLANEGGWSDGNCMRFYQGAVQPIGGWAKHDAASYTGAPRAALAWRTLEATKAVAWVTTSKTYNEIGGTRVDITPNLHQIVLTDCFTVANGSTTYTVTLTAHMLQVGDSITFANHSSTAGGRTISGTFTVTGVPTPDTFTFTNGSAANTDTTQGRGNVAFVEPMPTHYDNATKAAWGENLLIYYSGYGLFEHQPETTYAELISNGTFTGNATGWALGTGFTYSSNAITASAGTASNLSQNVEDILEPGRTYQLIVGVTRSAGTLKIQMNTGSSATPSQYQVTFSGTDTVNCFGLANQLAAGMAIQFQNSGGALPTGISANSTYYITHVGFTHADFQFSATLGGSEVAFSGAGTGTSTMSINLPSEVVIDIGNISATINKTGTYTRTFVCPSDPADIVFAKDSSFAGTIDNVSIKLMDKAYRITTAPPRIDAIVVDLVGIVIALGTTDLDQGDYSATLYRCSDLGNNKSWVPDTDSMATEQILRGIGGRLMGGINTAEQNIIGGDDGVLSLQYQGVAGNAFNPVFLGAGCGWISRHCAAAVNGIVLWMSNAAKFFIFQGAGIGSLGKPLPIGCPIETDVFGHLDASEWPVIHAGLNLGFQEAWFFYPDNRDSGSECSRVAAVAWTETDKNGAVPWMQHTIARGAWVASGTFSNPIGFGASGGSNYIYDHESGTLADGSALGWYLRSSSFDVQEGQTMTIIDELVMQMSSQVSNIGFSIFWRLDPADAWTETAFTGITPTTAYLYPEIKAREFQIKAYEDTAGAFMRYAPGNLRMNITPTQAYQ